MTVFAAPLSLRPGLYLVPTPIGNLRDITLRSLDILKAADILLCEDTRVTQKLLHHYGLQKTLWRYDEHTASTAAPKILAALAEGRSCALVTDAGSPLISDPGYRLARAVIDEGHHLEALPGPSAVLPALALSGLPADRFLFLGFPPNKSAARRSWLLPWAALDVTLIFYESAQRLVSSLADMAAILGETRLAAVARELSKLHEEIRRGNIRELAAHYENVGAPKGEIVILVGPPAQNSSSAQVGDWRADLVDALTRLSPAAAAAEIAALHSLPKRTVYAHALTLKGKVEE